MSSPKSAVGSAREGTRIVLREITATLQNSPPMQQSRSKSGNDATHPKTAEHEVKVRFAREFADVESTTFASPETLSSASSFHSLSSALSTKSSSGICPDSPYNDIIPNDIANKSYLNTSIPGLDDLITACGGLHLNEDNNRTISEAEIDGPENFEDQSIDQTFASAAEDSNVDITQEEIFQAESQDSSEPVENNATVLNSTCSIGDRTQDIRERPILTTLCTREPLPVVLYGSKNRTPSKVEESTEKSISSNNSDDANGGFKTCILVDDFEKFSSLPNINDSEKSNLNLTTCLPPNKSSADHSKTEEKISAEVTSVTETSLSPNGISCPTVNPTTCNTLPIENVNDSSLPSLPTISTLTELTDATFNETNANAPTDKVKEPLSRSASPEINTSALAIALAEDVLKSPIINEKFENVDLKELTQQNPYNLRRELIPANQLDADQTPIARPKTLVIPEILVANVHEEPEITPDNTVPSKIENIQEKDDSPVKKDTNLNSEQDLQPVDNPKLHEPTVTEKTEISKEPVQDLSKEEEERGESSGDTTITLEDVSFNLETEQDIEQYAAFQPQRQSTTLAQVNERPNFMQLKTAAEKVADDIINSTVEFQEETDTYTSATSEIFQDPTSFDFFLARSTSKNINRLRAESLYVKFDPLVHDNSIMLPQGNVQPINEEPSGKNENPLPNQETPKRNPALAAIDRLLFFSPLTPSTIQKADNPQEKIDQPTEESKQETPLINDINMSKELELVRTTVLQLEEKLEKQKKEYEAELEKQKTVLQEKISKLQTQMAQEVKSKSQMTVVVEEYEKSISRLLTERERDRTNFEQEKTKLQEELQATNVHLTNTEAAFNDVHQKYERLKGVVSAYKSNETVLKESIQENMETIKGLETRYDQLKNHAMAQLEKANFELDGIRKQHEDETVKLHALIRKAELKSNSFAELVEQKTKENKELTQILDEVIARVGHQNAD